MQLNHKDSTSLDSSKNCPQNPATHMGCMAWSRCFLEKTINKQDDGKPQKDVDDSTKQVEAKPADKPKNEKNNGNNVKHVHTLIDRTSG